MRPSITPLSMMNLYLMLGVSIILAVDDNLFVRDDVELYNFLLRAAPQGAYAAIAFLVSVVLFTALVFKNRKVEMVGLFFSGIYMLFILSGYLLDFPNISSVLVAVWTLSTFMTIVEVQEIYTKNDIDDHKLAEEKEEAKYQRRNERR